MLFNSYEFIFFFLPITLIGFWIFSSFQKRCFGTGWLIVVSLVFYSIWSLEFLFLLLFSTVFNWLVGRALAQRRKTLSIAEKLPTAVKLLLVLGISFNLGLLGYFKYVNFFIDTVNDFGLDLGRINGLILPLGISFYTFEHISYLVGIATGKGQHYSFPRYLLFITFFPHLIAGPILNANELISQFRQLNYRLDARNLAIGFTVFAVGLFKKTVIADSVAIYATPVFAAANQGESISFFLAWQAAIAYTLQLYFDFSGYSDMAIGLAKMVNIKLPMNFFSPYQAVSVSDFWRRWHISLGRFLRDYLYIPLGGSRKGELRRYANLLITMLLAGLWHGANWTFVIWGGLHGLYLCIDHGWKQFLKQQRLSFESGYHYWSARLLTFSAIVVSWVLFRSPTMSSAGSILMGMMGLNGFVLPEKLATQYGFLSRFGIQFGTLNNYADVNGCQILLLVLGFVFFLPNLYQFMIREPVALDIYGHLSNRKPAWYAWQPSVGYALLTLVLFIVALSFSNRISEFLYFQF